MRTCIIIMAAALMAACAGREPDLASVCIAAVREVHPELPEPSRLWAGSRDGHCLVVDRVPGLMGRHPAWFVDGHGLLTPANPAAAAAFELPPEREGKLYEEYRRRGWTDPAWWNAVMERTAAPGDAGKIQLDPGWEMLRELTAGGGRNP